VLTATLQCRIGQVVGPPMMVSSSRLGPRLGPTFTSNYVPRRLHQPALGKLFKNFSRSSTSTIVQRFHFRATSPPDLIAA
jgi:hypothetical protein